MEIISCIFGNEFKRMYRAPTANCTFFTNNPELQKEITDRGWKYRFIDFPLSDLYQSSLQSKWIKFLQFDLTEGEYLYHDHKIKITPAVIGRATKLSSKPILVTNQPINRNRNIMGEYKGSQDQLRYYRRRKQTLSYLEELERRGFRLDVPTMRTGFIYYKIDERVKQFANLIYSDCMKTKNPECQLFWGVRAPKYKDIIKCVKFEEIDYRHTCDRFGDGQWEQPAGGG